jgi:hypothetical protein
MLLRRRVEVRFEMGFPTLGIVCDVWSSIQANKSSIDKVGRLKKMYGQARRRAGANAGLRSCPVPSPLRNGACAGSSLQVAVAVGHSQQHPRPHLPDTQQLPNRPTRRFNRFFRTCAPPSRNLLSTFSL